MLFPIQRSLSKLLVWFTFATLSPVMTIASIFGKSCSAPSGDTVNASCINHGTIVANKSCSTASNSVDTPKESNEQIDPWFLSKEANSYTGNLDDFWDEMGCDEVFAEGNIRPIHNTSTWQFLRGVYLGVVGQHFSTIKLEDVFRDSGFGVPVKVEYIPGKGRGVIALQDIPKGTCVWDTIHTARFPSPVMYRRFLAAIPEDLACDVMIWAYVEDYVEVGFGAEQFESIARPTISVDLDAGSFLNTVSSTTNTSDLDPETYETTRLIKAGEELIVDYRDFEKEGYWDAAGFGTEHQDNLWP